jgi:hypothetical protein
VVEIEGRPGVFISGVMTPKLAGVTITISTDATDKTVVVETDDKGTYK